MRRTAAVLALVVMALGVMITETASAHGGRWSVGVGVGFGGYWPGYWGWPGYWYPPYAYYPPYYGYPGYPSVVTTAPEPVTYIERGDAQPAEAAAPRRDWWYYCPEVKTYYPYVKQCAGGWQKVEPQPQAER